MASDRVTLKEEQIVGDEVVLKDINPKTSTKSVDNSRTGENLDKTIELIWNAINNKLSRIVNSINGRTGVVVMTADDVGLGNVDNVSLGDIKKWVIDLLKREFETKRIRLYDSLNEVAADVAKNEDALKDTAFYSVHGMDDDFKSYVGYIYLNPITKKLVHTEKVVNVIGKTDNSIIYDEKVIDDDNDIKDYRGGKLGVNIWKYETALKIYNENGPKGESGLCIDQNALANNVYYFKGVYQDSDSEDGTALLYYQNIPASAPNVLILIDNTVVNNLKLKHTDFKIGDLIICDFKDYRATPGDPPSGMSVTMMSRNPAIGRVTSAPSMADPNDPYKISFHSIKPNAGWGLQYLNNHQDQVPDSLLSLKLATGNIDPSVGPVNVSGLQVLKSTDDMKLNDSNNKTNPKYDVLPLESLRHTVTPQGVIKALQINDSTVMGGLFVNPDMSLCVMPYKCYGNDGNGGSSLIKNWAVKSPSNDLNDSKLDNGSISDASLLGINLQKKVIHAGNISNKIRFTNTSGLRVNKQEDIGSSKESQAQWFGKTPNEITTLDENDYYSGGLSVNVGKFLEIGPTGESTTDDEYFDNGKINVRIGAGLEEAPDITYKNSDGETTTCKSNKLQVQVATLEVWDLVGPRSASSRRVTSGLTLRETPDKYTSMSAGLSVNVGSTAAGDYKGLKIYKSKRRMNGWLKDYHFYEEATCKNLMDKDESWIYIDNTVDENGNNLKTEYMYIQRFDQFVTTESVRVFYGFYKKSDKTFYKDNIFENKYTNIHQYDIYVDITTGNEMRYHDDVGDFVTIHSDGVVGIDYNPSRGLGLSDILALHVKIGTGLEFMDENIVSYESNTIYPFGSIIVVGQARVSDNNNVGTSEINKVYIYDAKSLESNTRRGYLVDDILFYQDLNNKILDKYCDESGIIYYDYLTQKKYRWEPSSRSYKEYKDDEKIALYFKSSSFKNIDSDIKKFGLREYYFEGQYDGANKKFYDNSGKEYVYVDGALYRDKWSGAVYKCLIDNSENVNFQLNYSKDTFESLSYQANKGGSIGIQLAPNGGLSIYIGESNETVHSGDLQINTGPGLAIENNRLVFDPSSLTNNQVVALKTKLGIS